MTALTSIVSSGAGWKRCRFQCRRRAREGLSIRWNTIPTRSCGGSLIGGRSFPRLACRITGKMPSDRLAAAELAAVLATFQNSALLQV
jgi:hypothetical protein